LGKYDYVANSTIGQSATAINGTKMLISIFPAIPFLLAVALLFFYEINKKMEVKIEADLKQRR
jgi:Na+/melibiose symporter-like transporter